MNILYDNGQLINPSTKRVLGYLEKSNGYMRFSYNYKKFYVHRVVWEIHHGNIPNGFEIDHINQNKLDNRIENLRLVSHIDNNKNKGLNKNNTSGFVGVCWDKRSSKWFSYITVNSKQISLGLFKEKDKAISARKEANLFYGFSENHGLIVK